MVSKQWPMYLKTLTLQFFSTHESIASHFTVLKNHELGEKFISIQDPNTILWAVFNMYLSTTAVMQVLQ
jgi:hypothetical protein